MKPHANLHKTVFDLVDGVVEIYLSTAIKPFLTFHERFYNAMNGVLRRALDKNKAKIPAWFTANFITYARTWLVIPALLLLAWGHNLLPAIIVLSVDFGDFLDGVVARFWVDVKQHNTSSKDGKGSSSAASSSVAAPDSDDDSFEVVTTGSRRSVLSLVKTQRNKSYGGFVDAVCDKAFLIPIWIALLSRVPGTNHFHIIQYVALIGLFLAETASGCVRFQAYFSSPGMNAPKVDGFDFSTSAVKADHVGKAKQTFEMVGTTLFILPLAKYIGLCLLLAALPLAYESVRRKVRPRVIYVSTHADKFDYKMMKFWMQVKAMGSYLIVGVPGEKQTDMVHNACACSCVDEAIAEAPAKADLIFLENHNIDFVVTACGQDATKTVTDEVIGSNRCLAVGDDGVARPMKSKVAEKEE